MPLILPILQARFIQIFQARMENTSQIADKISAAYADYVQFALGPMGDPIIFVGTEKQYVKIALTNVFKARLPQPSASALVGMAVFQFWMAPPAKTALGGFVSACIPAPGIAKMASVDAKDVVRAAQEFASCFDVMTRTVIVTYPPGVGPPGMLI